MIRALALVLALASGCGGGMPHAYGPSSASRARRTQGETTVVAEHARGGGSSAPSFWFADSEVQLASVVDYRAGDIALEERVAPPREDRIAQAQTALTPPEPTATDAVDTSRELLIYTALFHVGVYDIEASQAAIAESARAAGGFVFSQGDDALVVRIPAAHFMSFVTQIDGTYDVLHRQMEAQDVGEEFRDVEIRIRNLETMRERVAALLTGATDVEQALAVEQQLERITAELESLRGRQRFLADRIAFSTVTILFRPQPHDAIDHPEIFQLPFGWLEGLGLPNLMELR